MYISEVIKPLTPAQSRINHLKLQKDNVSKQLKAERDRQRIAKAQQQLAKALHPSAVI
jgi:hypothetical protein